MSDHKQREPETTQLTQAQLEYAENYLKFLNEFIDKNKEKDLGDAANEYVKNTGQCLVDKKSVDFETIKPHLSNLKKTEKNENDLIYEKDSKKISIRIARVESSVKATGLENLPLGGEILLDSIDANIKNELEKQKITGFSNNKEIIKEIFSGYSNKNPAIKEEKDKYFFSEEFIKFIPEKIKKIQSTIEELRKYSESKESKEQKEKIYNLETEIQKFPIKLLNETCDSNTITLNSQFSGKKPIILQALSESKILKEFSANSFEINPYGEIEVGFDTKENAKIVFDIWSKLQDQMLEGLGASPDEQKYLVSTLFSAINNKANNLFTTHYPKSDDPYTWSIRTAPQDSPAKAEEIARVANESITKNKLGFQAQILPDRSVEIVRDDGKPLHYGFAVTFYKEPTVEPTLAEDPPLSNLQRLNYWAGENKKMIAICGIALGSTLVGSTLVGKYAFGDAKHLFDLKIPSTHLTAGGALGIAIGGMLFCALMYGLYKNRHTIKEKTTETWCRFFGSGHRQPIALDKTPLLAQNPEGSFSSSYSSPR